MNFRNLFLISLISAASVFSLKVTAVSMAVSANADSNLQTIKAGLSQATGDLVVFPELALCNASSGKDQIWVDNAVNELKTLCAQKQKHLVFGAIRISGGFTYNSAYIINASGALVGTYDQIHPLSSGYSPGLRIPAFALATSDGNIKIGVQIGNDLYFPEPWQFFAERAIHAYFLVFLSSLTSSESWKKGMQDDLFLAHVADNTVFGVSASAAATTSAVSTQICDGVGNTLAQQDPTTGPGSAYFDASIINATFFFFKRHDEWRTDLYSLVLKTPVAAAEAPAARRTVRFTAGAHPNPLPAGAMAAIYLPDEIISGNCQSNIVAIYTLQGRLIKNLSISSTHPFVSWDGRDNKGNPLSPGVYPFMLRGPGMQKKFAGNIVVIP
jgi:predicted amidohydrolase